MKFVNVDKLKIGDWVVTTREIKRGKFQFGKIIGYKLNEVNNIDLDRIGLVEQGAGCLDGAGAIYLLNKKDLDNLLKLKVKLGVIKGLK